MNLPVLTSAFSHSVILPTSPLAFNNSLFLKSVRRPIPYGLFIRFPMKLHDLKKMMSHHRRLIYHLKVLAGTFITTFFFLWITGGKLETPVLLRMLPLVFVQLELFLWMGLKFFPDSPGEKGPLTYNIRYILLRLLIFYLSVLAIAALFFIGALCLNAVVSNQPLKVIFDAFLQWEWKGFVGAAASGFMIGIIIFFYFQWSGALRREQKLREEKLIFRYETLRNQVNPHFLFNSLNTLASLVESHPATAGAYIAGLASMYRYVLEKQEIDWVPLPDELAFARNYFELQKIRYGEKIFLEEEIPFPENFRIMPISLQILLENVFKHNSASLEYPLTVSLKLVEGPGLEVTNTLRAKNRPDTSLKTGLHNLGERYRLLAGRDIRITETPGTFGVLIPLLLKK